MSPRTEKADPAEAQMPSLAQQVTTWTADEMIRSPVFPK